MKKKPIVAGVGELLWDLLPDGKQLGGAPCNFAFHAKQAGCDSFVVSAIGNDDPGRELMKTVNHLGISGQYIQQNNFPTGTVSISLDQNGHPDYTIHEQVAWDHIKWNPQIRELAETLDAVCFGSLAQRNSVSEASVVSLVSSVRPGCLRIFDINLRQHFYSKESVFQSLILSDVLKLNDDELPVLTDFFNLNGDVERQLKQLLDQFSLKYVVYTMGGKGSIIAGEDEYSFIRAPEVKVADTVGAGDAFTAVFTAGILLGIPLVQVHTKATEIAAWVCTRKGAMPESKTLIF